MRQCWIVNYRLRVWMLQSKVIRNRLFGGGYRRPNPWPQWKKGEWGDHKSWRCLCVS